MKFKISPIKLDSLLLIKILKTTNLPYKVLFIVNKMLKKQLIKQTVR